MLATADICDDHPEARAAEPIFRDFGGHFGFGGPIATVKVFEDNVLVRTALEEDGEGRVLVVDGGGSKRCALLGGRLAALARDNGWAGVIVYGCIRDAAEIARVEVGVKALATHPQKSTKRGEGSRGEVVTFAGVTFTPGAYVYADADGVVVTEKPVTSVS